jgi:creatinine amidohydrolase/Fe(II)-dependent formamide hydrolase-like protein
MKSLWNYPMPTAAYRALLLICLGLSLANPVQAAPAGSVYLEELTWTELRHRVQEGNVTVIIPVGGTEQNGLQMTLGKHTTRVRFLSGAIAKELGNTLVAPALPVVPEGSITPPTGHMKFPGTLTISEAAFHSTLASLAESLKQAGFHRIVLLADHGGNQKSLSQVADELNRKWASSGTRVLALTEYYQAAASDYAQWLKAQGYAPSAIGEHAGLADTSLMLAIDPHEVRASPDHSLLSPGEADGARGDPKGATPELGQWAVKHIVSTSVKAIRAFQAPVR